MSGAVPSRPTAIEQPQVAAYVVTLAAFFLSVVLLLGTVVDMRRAFLSSPDAYRKLGAPSAFLSYTPTHLVLLLLALGGAWLAYRALRAQEVRLRTTRFDFASARNLLAIALMVVLVVDLFVYRVVQASRVADAGRIGVARTFDLEALPDWLRPVGEAANFLLVVWHATALGIVIGALFLVLLCTNKRLERVLQFTGFRGHLTGSVSALAYPFCSCCAGPLGASLYRGGASLNASLSLVTAAPLLNVTSLFLAVTLLPSDFATLRIVGGVALAVFGTWLVALAVRHNPPVVAAGPSPRRGWRFLARLVEAFAFERVVLQRPVETPSDLIGAWLRTSLSIARVAVPMLFVAAVMIGWAAPIVTTLGGGNTFATVLVAAFLGTLFMIPTWTELAVAIPLIQQGLSGPAAALLLALPAVSLPSLLVFGAALRDWRIPALLALVVFVASTLAGALFL